METYLWKPVFPLGSQIHIGSPWSETGLTDSFKPPHCRWYNIPAHETSSHSVHVHYEFLHCVTVSAHVRLDTSALADHPDPYPRVFLALNAALGSSQVCSHRYSHPQVGYSQVYTTILTITTSSVTTTTTITTKQTKQKRNGRVGVKVRPFCSSFFILQ